MKRLLVGLLAICLLVAGCGPAMEEAPVVEAGTGNAEDGMPVSESAEDLPPTAPGVDAPTGKRDLIPGPNEEVPNFSRQPSITNGTGHTISEIRASLNGDEVVLCSSLQPGESAEVEYPGWWRMNYDDQTAALFTLVIGSEEIPVLRARHLHPAGSFVWESLTPGDYDHAFFEDEDGLFYSKQPDFPDLLEQAEAEDTVVDYIYLPTVRRWMARHHEDQVLFAVGLRPEEILEYFPHFGEDGVPRNSPAVLIATEPVQLEWINVEVGTEYAKEGRRSVPHYTFTELDVYRDLGELAPGDAVIIPTDHIQLGMVYFRYTDSRGKLHRQYIDRQGTNPDNGGALNIYIPEDDTKHTIVSGE